MAAMTSDVGRSRFADVLMSSQPAPAHRRPLASIGVDDRGPLSGGSAVRPAEAPRHLEDALDIGDRLHPQVAWPRRVLGLDEVIAGRVESTGRRAELLAFVRGQSLIIGLERFGPLEPHESRSARSSSTPSTVVMRPAATSDEYDAALGRYGFESLAPRFASWDQCGRQPPGPVLSEIFVQVMPFHVQVSPHAWLPFAIAPP
jgi:hypothetical protein